MFRNVFADLAQRRQAERGGYASLDGGEIVSVENPQAHRESDQENSDDCEKKIGSGNLRQRSAMTEVRCAAGHYAEEIPLKIGEEYWGFNTE